MARSDKNASEASGSAPAANADQLATLVNQITQLQAEIRQKGDQTDEKLAVIAGRMDQLDDVSMAIGSAELRPARVSGDYEWKAAHNKKRYHTLERIAEEAEVVERMSDKLAQEDPEGPVGDVAAAITKGVLPRIYEAMRDVRLADREGWKVVEAYRGDEFAIDSDDEKRLKKARKLVMEEANYSKKEKNPKPPGGKRATRPNRAVWQWPQPQPQPHWWNQAPVPGFGPSRPAGGQRPVGPCFVCKQMGHVAAQCPSKAGGLSAPM